MQLSENQTNDMTAKGWDLHINAFGDTKGNKKMSSLPFDYAYQGDSIWDSDFKAINTRKSISFAYPSSMHAKALGKSETGAWHVAVSYRGLGGIWSAAEILDEHIEHSFDIASHPDLLRMYTLIDAEHCPSFLEYGNLNALIDLGLKSNLPKDRKERGSDSLIKDKRYTIQMEYNGNAKAQSVVRFCGDYLAGHEEYDSAIGIMKTHIEERRLVLNGAESVPCRLNTYEGLEEATVTYNKSLGSTATGIVTSKSRKYAIRVRNSTIIGRLGGDGLDSVPTFDAC